MKPPTFISAEAPTLNYRIAPAEWRWLGGISVFILALSYLPYLVGQARQTEGWVFSGAINNRPDYNVYMACLQAGRHGLWAYPMLHTSEPMPPTYFRLAYVALGQLGRWLPLSAPALFQLARLVCGGWMLVMLYVFIANFLGPVALRRAAFGLGVFGSGLGWLAVLFWAWWPAQWYHPIDFWLTDLYGFYSLLLFPHFSAIAALLWTTAVLMLAHWRTRQWRWLGLAMLAAVVAQAMQPFITLTVDLALGGYGLWGWWQRKQIVRQELVSLILLALAQLPLLGYAVRFFWGHPLWQIVAQQNQVTSPTPPEYALGLGLLGLLALAGGWAVVRQRLRHLQLPLMWVLAVSGLVYAPLGLQRRFAEGVLAPLAVLAVVGLSRGLLPLMRRVWQRLGHGRYPFRRPRRWGWALALAFTMPSTLYLLLACVALALARSPVLFYPANVVHAVDWLGAHSRWDETVLAAEPAGSFIPARIGHRVFLGHWVETVNFEAKLIQVQTFYSAATTNAERQTLLAECGCRFVFYGPDEQSLGPFKPETANFLQAVYVRDNVSIYAVSAGEETP